MQMIYIQDGVKLFNLIGSGEEGAIWGMACLGIKRENIGNNEIVHYICCFFDELTKLEIKRYIYYLGIEQCH